MFTKPQAFDDVVVEPSDHYGLRVDMLVTSAALLPLGLTPGCPAGVGPEVLVRALAAIADDAVPLGTPLHFFASEGLLVRAVGYARVVVRREGNDVVIGRRRVRAASTTPTMLSCRCLRGLSPSTPCGVSAMGWWRRSLPLRGASCRPS